MKVLAIDPGNEQSAYVVLDGDSVEDRGILSNNVLMGRLEVFHTDRCVIEMIASYGMPVGREVFDTVFWIGRFYEASIGWGYKPELVYRKQVVLHHCNSPRANDSNIIRAMKDRYGGDKCKGTKKKPGPLNGFKEDIWQALALGLYWIDTHKV